MQFTMNLTKKPSQLSTKRKQTNKKGPIDTSSVEAMLKSMNL